MQELEATLKSFQEDKQNEIERLKLIIEEKESIILHY